MHQRIGMFDDFWTTGIWVGLRIFFLPVVIFLLFLVGKEALATGQMPGPDMVFDRVNAALGQLSQAGITRGDFGSYGFTGSSGAKFVRP